MTAEKEKEGEKNEWHIKPRRKEMDTAGINQDRIVTISQRQMQRKF